MTPSQKIIFDEVRLYMKNMARGDHEDRVKLRKRVIRQYASDHCTGSGKSCDQMEVEIAELVGEI